MIERQIDSPRPMPFGLVVWKALKRFSTAAGASPGPEIANGRGAQGAQSFFWRRQPPIASFLFLPSAAGLKSRPFLHDWLRTHAIAPDTHEDQALIEPCGFPSPWRLGRPRRTLVPRPVQEISQFPWLSVSQLQSPAGSRRGRSASHCRWRWRSGVQFSSAGCNPNHRTWLTGPPSVLQAKQRVTSNGRPSFRMW